jgi:uncharacterized protein (DUF983 family)
VDWRRVRRIMGRGCRLRCPRCGAAGVFDGWLRMRPRCPGCGLVFEREPGYFVGAIYLNYGVTAVTAVAGYFLLDTWLGLGTRAQLLVGGAFAVAFPFWFFRYSKSLWLSVDHLVDPTERGPEPPPR